MRQRTTATDWFDLYPHMPDGPVAITSSELDALSLAFDGRPRTRPSPPNATMLGHYIVEIPDWPDWLP